MVDEKRMKNTDLGSHTTDATWCRASIFIGVTEEGSGSEISGSIIENAYTSQAFYSIFFRQIHYLFGFLEESR
jgi:hypothetical protein